jgi:D-alanyl-D-alanine carboxypeptidase-like protein
MSSNIEPAAALVPPHGLDQIRNTFGDIFAYIGADHALDPRWQTELLTLAPLPFSLPLSWDSSRLVSQITCHKLLAEIFSDVFARIQREGVQERITSFGGCFSFRPQRTGNKLSAHAWGIAIDLNPQSNAQGTTGNMDSGVVRIFGDAGFEWGGDWQGRTRDPMHFQFCTGY